MVLKALDDDDVDDDDDPFKATVLHRLGCTTPGHGIVISTEARKPKAIPIFNAYCINR